MRKTVGAVLVGMMLVVLTGSSMAMGKSPEETGAGQEESQNVEEAKIKPKATSMALEKIWEKKFDEDVKDVIFDEGEFTVERAKAMGVKGLEGRKPKEKVKINYPKVIMTKDSLKFLDKEGNLKKKYNIVRSVDKGKVVKVYPSRNGKKIGMVSEKYKYFPEKDMSFVESVEFKMLNDDGEVEWEIKNANRGSILPSPDGDYAVGFYDKGPLYFYKDGKKKNIENLPNRYSGDIALSRDGKFWIASVNVFRPRKSWLILFDNNGEEIWRRDLKAARSHELKFSNNGEFIVVSVTRGGGWPKRMTGSLLLYDKEGQLVLEKTAPVGSYAFDFSPDDKFLFVAVNHDCYLYDVLSGEKRWEYYRSEDMVRATVSSTLNYSFILLGVLAKSKPGEERGNNVIYLFDKDGNKLWEETFEPNYITHNLNSQNPNIDISTNGREIIINTKNGIEIFKNPYAE
ncbi:PQQ-like beta-propeller repeat protein [bacterium]|nr:PQQ-like beta-propeller repeat protein [bacterium]